MHAILLLLAYFCIAGAQNIGYDCTTDQSNYTTISLVDVGECVFDEDDISEEVTEIQLLQTKEVKFIDTFSCLINLHYTINYCGMHSHNSLVKGGVVVETYRVSNEECKAMHQLRRARVYGQEYQIEEFNVTTTRWITLAGGIDRDGTCSRGDFNNRYGNYRGVVVHGQVSMMFSTGVALRSVKDSSVRLPSGIVCESDSVSCIDPTYGYVFWKTRDLYPCSEDAYHVVYQGTATKVSTILGRNRDGSVRRSVMFSVQDDQQMFTLNTVEEKEVCRYHMYQTEHPKYLIYETKNRVYPFKQEQIPTNELDLFMYVNAKIVYVARRVERSMKAMFRALSTEICELERSQLRTLMSIGFSNPSHFAYQYMNSPGYTAIAAGEVIHVIKCTPVPIRPRASKDCTIEYPVYYANESYFISPRTHILQRSATPVPCSDLLSAEYKISNKWYAFRNTMHPALSPIVISPKNPPKWKGLDLGNLINAGIYTSEQIEQIRHQIMYPQERKAIKEIFAGALNKDSVSHNTLDYGIFINEEKLKNKFHQWWLETWGIFKFIGDLGSIAFSFYIIYVALTSLSKAIFRLKALHEIFGCSLILVTAVVDGLSDYILHRNSHRFKDVQVRNVAKEEEKNNGEGGSLQMIMMHPPQTRKNEYSFVDIPNKHNGHGDAC